MLSGGRGMGAGGRIAAAAWVAACALAAAVPDPAAHFGHPIGADRTVLDWDKVVSYFRAVDAGEDRVRVEQLGASTEGRPFLAAFISSAGTLRELHRHLEVQRRLASAEPDAEKLIPQGKAVVMITCSIHATEIASTHTAVEFLYRLLTEDTRRHRAILDNVIFILVPSLNPDGVDIVTGWYRKTLGTPFEGTSPPQLYHKYVGHDNNRDWYIFSQVETRLVIAQLHNVWHPHIVYDVHQQGVGASRLFVPPWLDPIEPNIDPLIVQQCNMYGTAMAADLTAAGKTGISINASYDFWTPARHYQAYHGGLRILSESASARIATPVTLRLEDLQRESLGYSPRERSWNHIEPWPGGTWRLRDIIDYQLLAWESLLYNAALHREDLVGNSYRIGRRQAARTSPWGFRVPARQRDPGATRKLLETLAFGQVRIDGAASGDWIIRMQQPYSGFAKTLLERQQYPDLRLYPGGPPKPPYDVTAHTLPLLMGVEVETLERPLEERLQPARIEEAPRESWSAADTDAWRTVNQAWKAGRVIWRDMSSGDFAPQARPGWKEIRRPRIGLYKPWQASMDEGWTRWLLEHFGFSYASLANRDLQAGRLREQFDVIVFADMPAAVIENGHKPGTMPEEYVGGLGGQGEAALRDFASGGGTLVFLNRSTQYALDRLGVQAKDVLRGLSRQQFYCPGSLLTVKLEKGHPLALGLPDEIAIWSEHSPAWESGERTVARYPERGLLASGWLLGENHLARRAALLEARMGAGRLVLFGMRPQYRAQSYQAFKLFFNAMLHF